jgi:hypothetical protein
MKNRIAFVLSLVSAFPATAESPIAEVVCAGRAVMVNKLTYAYGSSVAATGLRDIEAVIEVWTAPNGRWTLVQTYTDGMTCILAMGEAWDMPPQADAR